jgi:hypothetical protein
LLERAAKRAKALGISRNRLIVRALERELEQGADWSHGFFDRLRTVDKDTVHAVEEMLAAIKTGRRSKAPQQF